MVAEPTTRGAVLAAIDLSTSSRPVARRAEQIARQSRRKLVLAHVDPAGPAAPADALIPAGWGTSLRTGAGPRKRALGGAAARRSSAVLEDWARRAGVAPDALRTLVGRTHTALLSAARAAKAKLIVTGAHRAGGRAETYLLGTTADRLLRKSDAPVLLVRTGARRPYRSVLVAMDLGGTNRDLLRAALELAPGAVFHLVHAVPKEAVMGSLPGRRPAARRRLEALASDAGLPEERRTLTVLEGDAREKILQAAGRKAADLIVVGTQARKGLERLLLGSTAEHVLRAAEVDVLAVPPRR